VLAVAVLAVVPPAVGWRGAWPLAPTFWGAFGCVLLADALACPRRERVRFELAAPGTLYVGGAAEAELEVRFPRAGRGTRVRATLDVSERLDPVGARTVEAEAGAARVAFRLVPRRRGTATLDRLWLEWTSPLRLWERRAVHELGREVVVLPDLPRVERTALRFFADRSFRTGLKIERYRGDGTEFESLKEFVLGDDHRGIDWKASARHRALLTRQFRAERNHQIVVAVDTGHLMCEPIQGVPKLDHALNAALVLGWVGLASGDRVGLYSFDARVGPGLAPVSGPRAMAALVEATARIEYSDTETNYTLGLTTLGQRLRRRSLVILLTDFVDTITAELMVENVDRIVRRHVVAFVSVRDPLVERVADDVPATVERLNRAVVADSFLQDREVVHRRLRRLGVHALDAVPERVGPALINRYLDIKRRELV